VSNTEKRKAIRKERARSAKINGVTIDAKTAAMISLVSEALSETHRAQFSEMEVGLQAAIAWKLVNKYGS